MFDALPCHDQPCHDQLPERGHGRQMFLAIDLKLNDWRGFKTRGRHRQIPLTGASSWAAQRIKKRILHTDSFYVPPRYISAKATNASSALVAINKWLKPKVPEGCVIHSFRHSRRDRLRAAPCPADIPCQTARWVTAGIGQR